MCCSRIIQSSGDGDSPRQKRGQPPFPSFESVAARLLQGMQATNFRGWDPYDGLASPLFSFLTHGDSAARRFARTAVIQLLKRSPLNFRLFLRTPRLLNPKALGLVLSGLVRFPAGLDDGARRNLVRRLADTLWELRQETGAGVAWGYPFPWQSRAFFAPAGTSNAVVTVFCGLALSEAATFLDVPQWQERIEGIVRFFTQGLTITREGKQVIFPYTIRDSSRIYNVNLLIAGFLARTGGKDSPEVARLIRGAVEFVLANQKPDGSWDYGAAGNQRWNDHFHTGFNLVALRTIRRHFPAPPEWAAAEQKGFRFYRDHFFTADGLPRYFPDAAYPVDVHSLAQAIITLTQFGEMDFAHTVAGWGIKHLYDVRCGSFFFQRHRWYCNRIDYLRWGQAWMFRALCELRALKTPNAL